MSSITRIALIGCGAIGTSVLELLQARREPGGHGHRRAGRWRWRGAAPRRERLAPRAASRVVACPSKASTSSSKPRAMPRSRRTCCRRCSAARPASWPRWARCRPQGLAEKLEAAAVAGGTQVQLIAGAIGAIDALAAARIGGLDAVRYTGRKPPHAWKGTPAEQGRDLDALTRRNRDLRRQRPRGRHALSEERQRGRHACRSPGSAWTARWCA